ncbi:hypothetical protein MANES_09G187800v8 [Manihot esculenta]|uniref:Uncharacterized protein n=2 Tax=Manihot esculenta TaxID=3983 RepID=A0ACB7H6R4_MANES|nr:hypothetical protein MANES_09G187800v8 [Manihot esculenta]KAG8648393.1 hypothetical protein MANES_09G187800v8 [Manihot esculenta]
MGRLSRRSNISTKTSKEQETQRKILQFPVTNKFAQNVQKIKYKEFLLERRVSPRLKAIPKDKRPYYGSIRRRKLCASKDDVCSGKTEDDDKRRQFDSPEDNAVMNKAKDGGRKNLSDHVSKKRSEGVFLERRVSPRLKNISADKRPYYGSVQRRKFGSSTDYACHKKTEGNEWKKQLDSPKDNAGKEKTKADITFTNTVQRVPGLNLKQRGSSRLKNTPVDKRLFHVRDDLCGRKNKNDHQIILPHYPDGSVSEKKRKADLLDLASKDGEDRGGKIDFALGIEPLEHDDTAIMDLKAEAHLEHTSSESFPAEGMHQISSAKVMVVSPLMLMCKVINNRVQNSSKQESEKDVFGVNIVQQFQKLALLERRVSPRLKGIPKDRRPYYGSTWKGQLNTAKGYVWNNNDPKKQLHSSEDNTKKKKTEVNHSMQQSLSKAAAKDICDRDAESLLASGFLPLKCEDTEIMGLENGAYVKSMDHKKLLLNCIRHKAGAKERVSKDSSKLPGLVCEDISYGEEDIPIPVTNMIDPPIAPTGLKYTNSIHIATNLSIPSSPSGCNCKGNCTNPKSCSCALLNGSDFPYVRKDGGRLIEPKDVVFECGPRCRCGPKCINRISQRGLKYRLEVYRTLKKGWAVRSWDFIPSGAPVCEYTGILRRSSELDNVSENEFIFQIDCWHTMNGIGGRERRQGGVSRHARNLMKKLDKAEMYFELPP